MLSFRDHNSRESQMCCNVPLINWLIRANASNTCVFNHRTMLAIAQRPGMQRWLACCFCLRSWPWWHISLQSVLISHRRLSALHITTLFQQPQCCYMHTPKYWYFATVSLMSITDIFIPAYVGRLGSAYHSSSISCSWTTHLKMSHLSPLTYLPYALRRMQSLIHHEPFTIFVLG